MALSLVITSWLGTSITCSITLMLAPDAVDERDDEGEAGMERARVAAEALDRIVVALRHDFDARRDHRDKQNEQSNGEDIEAEHWAPSREVS